MSRAWGSAVLIAFAVVAVSCAPPESGEPEAAAAPAPVEVVAEATVADPGHYKVEFENERVRVVRIAYAPGDTSVMHHHPDHVTVMLTDLHGEFHTPEGTTEMVHAEAGQHVFMAAGAHHPQSTGTEPFEAVAVEIKAAGAGAPPSAEDAALDATVVDPKHYVVEFENDQVRVVRIRYGAGEKSVMHYHPDHVAVMLTDLHSEFQAPDGTTQEVQVKAGEHIYVTAGRHHPRNLGDTAFEAVAVELK